MSDSLCLIDRLRDTSAPLSEEELQGYIAAGADLRAVDDGQCALSLAIHGLDDATVRRIARFGYDDSRAMSLTWWAVVMGRLALYVEVGGRIARRDDAEESLEELAVWSEINVEETLAVLAASRV